MTHPSSRTPTVCAQQDALRKFARALLVGHGASVDHARIVVDHLIEAETMGLRSHGMIRVPQYLADIASGEIDPKATPYFERSPPCRARVDGGRGFGQVVGQAMGVYHPHGDSAIYDTLVRMAQPFSLRYPLVDGQGNFGSVDGDPPAAMRYTECRMERIAGELLADIDMETVDFVPNYDESTFEPSVLPTRIPNIIVNGSSGIAVGMETPATGLGKTQADPVVGELDCCPSLLADPSSIEIVLGGITIDSSTTCPGQDGSPVPCIEYAGLTATQAALYQINLLLPSGIGTNPAFQVLVGGQASMVGNQLALQ